MKVLVDSNVLIDVILQRKEFFADSRSALLLVANRKAKGYVSASAITDIYLQFCAAKRCGVKCILTRDADGFSNSDIPVLSPKEFLLRIK